jgi:hypothetical protein
MGFANLVSRGGCVVGVRTKVTQPAGCTPYENTAMLWKLGEQCVKKY